MSIFDLVLEISPSFHRRCSIRIEGGITGQATFEACAAGLLPRLKLTLPVDHELVVAIRGTCSSMLVGWDMRWSQTGLDGIGIDGVFDSSDSKPQAFSLWSPRTGSIPHTLLAAALECFPIEQSYGAAGELLDIVRSYFGLQPPITVTKDKPIRLRLAPWVHAKDALEVERRVTMLPDEGDIIVDATGVERFGGALASILPLEHLLRRSGTVRWKVRSDFLDTLIQSGVEQSLIEIVHTGRISPKGEPIVLGGIFVSQDLVSMAKTGDRIELVRSFRKEFGLTVEQASKAATELLEVLVL